MEIAAIIFLIVMAGVAYIVFKLLKKAVKMAFRGAIVLIILAIGITGGLALWSLGGKTLPEKTPASKKSK